APFGEAAVVIQHERGAAAHARREVASRRPDDHHRAARHVLAAVIADALDDGGGSAVAHPEPLAGDATDERFARRRTVERDVADDDVVLGTPARALRWSDHDASARESLAHVVVGLAAQHEGDAWCEPRAERLSRRPIELDVDGIVAQAAGAVPPCDLAAEHGADGTVHVADARGAASHAPAI